MTKTGKRVIVAAISIALLLGIVVVPSFLKARQQSLRNACINNLQQLTAPMMCCIPLEKKLAVGDKLDPKEVYLYMKEVPVCPAGGVYQVTWVVGGATPKCSVHGDVFWDLYHVRTLLELEELNHKGETAPKGSRNKASAAPSP
jgi:hypothetical protein